LQKRCKSFCLLLVCALLLAAASCTPAQDNAQGALTFTDSTGYEVRLSARPTRVAVLFSSLAELWLSAGGEVTMTVGESIERGILPNTVTVLADGAGKTPSPEAVIAAAPELVILSADLAGHVSCAARLRAAGIPTALFRVECFSDYLSVLKICTNVNGRPELYEQLGLAQKAAIDALIASKPLAGKRVLFARVASDAVRSKTSADHFAAAMLCELGAVNIADGNTVAGSLGTEAILREDPDLLVFVSMGNEQAARDHLAQTLESEAWGALRAVQSNACELLPRRLFHYKPNARWAEAYAHLAQIVS
jgi:iron complex transport system substrate-binding protein